MAGDQCADHNLVDECLKAFYGKDRWRILKRVLLPEMLVEQRRRMTEVVEVVSSSRGAQTSPHRA